MKLEEILPEIRKGRKFRMVGKQKEFKSFYGSVFSDFSDDWINAEWELEPTKEEEVENKIFEFLREEDAKGLFNYLDQFKGRYAVMYFLKALWEFYGECPVSSDFMWTVMQNSLEKYE